MWGRRLASVREWLVAPAAKTAAGVHSVQPAHLHVFSPNERAASRLSSHFYAIARGGELP